MRWSGTVFTAIANKVYASSLKYHKPVNVEGETKTELPISMDGNSYDLTQSYRVLNIPYRMEKQTTWVNTKTKTGHVDLLERYVGKKTVPNVIGMTAKDAVFLLERTGLKAKIEGYGMVTHQSLNPGEEVVRGKSIQIKLN